MSSDLDLQWSEPWQETETFSRLLAGPRFGTPPTDERGVVVRHYSTTINRRPFLRDHPKMRVDLSDPDDREYVARTIWRYSRPAYVGVLDAPFRTFSNFFTMRASLTDCALSNWLARTLP